LAGIGKSAPTGTGSSSGSITTTFPPSQIPFSLKPMF